MVPASFGWEKLVEVGLAGLRSAVGLFAGGLLLSCAPEAPTAGGLMPIPGTTTRVSEALTEEQESDRGLELQIFTHADHCSGARILPEEYPLCLPSVDRATGEVRLAYKLFSSGVGFDLPEHKAQLRLFHNGSTVETSDYMVVPHNPSEDGYQLYVILIDGSASMWEDDRMEKVRKALLREDVIDQFLPGDRKNGVILLQFTQGQPVPVGGGLQVLRDRKAYKQAVRSLQVLSGYTHLFDAITWATGPLLRTELLTEETGNGANISLVALTDGFNNLGPTDTCASNADRLETLLKHIKSVREGTEVDLRKRPTIHTVGLGRKLRKKFELPESRDGGISERMLCGEAFADRRIDGDLERVGIDNASLAFIADRGGGVSVVAQGAAGLADAFRRTAARRYQWFEVRYRIPSFYLRRSFRTRLQIFGFARAASSVTIHPSAWLDAPPAAIDPVDGWHTRSYFAQTLLVVMPLLSILVVFSYLGAAFFNVKRALTRLRPPRPPKT
jgi:hypothetical protein